MLLGWCETLELCRLLKLYCFVHAYIGISVPPPPSLMSFPPPRHLTASTTLTASTNFHHQGRPRPPFGGRGPGKPSDTLIIRKIPRELNTITKLSSHFEKFGTVVNLTVRLCQLYTQCHVPSPRQLLTRTCVCTFG